VAEASAQVAAGGTVRPARLYCVAEERLRVEGARGQLKEQTLLGPSCGLRLLHAVAAEWMNGGWGFVAANDAGGAGAPQGQWADSRAVEQVRARTKTCLLWLRLCVSTAHDG
jgi:hypothetical protein